LDEWEATASPPCPRAAAPSRFDHTLHWLAVQSNRSRAQVSVKVYNFTITFTGGVDLELESPDKGGVTNVVGAINGRVRS
jgi:hypothetical protein